MSYLAGEAGKDIADKYTISSFFFSKRLYISF